MKIQLITATAIAALTLAACNGADNNDADAGTETASSEDQGALDSMNYREGATDDFEAPRYMQLEVTLDSVGFSPGVIDGKMDMNTQNALRAFQEKEGLEVTGDYDEATQKAMQGRLLSSATRIVQIPESWAKKSYSEVPDDAAAQAKMDRLGYGSLWERLAERFHTTPEILYGLNPALCGGSSGETAPADGNAAQSASPDQSVSSDDQAAAPSNKAYRDLSECSFSGNLADEDVRVPNISDRPVNRAEVDDAAWADTLASLGVAQDQPKAAKIVVDKSDSMLRAFDAEGNLLTAYTVTSGSSQDPLPLGDWSINGISYNPEFSYDPDLFWDVPDSNPDQMLPPGPNGPVGVVWIDLTKEHYGIHGTSAPETIGTAQSHGCVRLTNWDAAELAQMVDSSTEVVFQA